MKEILVCGGLLIDRYLNIDRYPERGGDGYISAGFDVVGGCAVNIAKTVKNLGAVPYIVSSVGNDTEGDEITEFLRRERFPADCVSRTAGKTGYCMVFSEADGERTFLTYKGCEAEYSDALIPENVAVACGVAAVTGYYMLDGSSARLVDRLKTLKGSGYKIVFDPGPLTDKISERLLKEMISISDVLTPGESEARFIAAGDSESWALACNESGIDVVLKKGAAGGILYKDGVKIPYDAVKVNTVDTTGAGDSFTGAVAYALGNGIPAEKGVKLAAATAAAVSSVKGPHCDFKISDLTAEAQAIWKEYSSVG